MGIKSKIKHSISFLLHGEAKPIYANIHYLAPNEHLKDKKIVITGGGRGLGFAMAKKFVTEGAQVLIAGRNEQTLKQSAAEINCQYLNLMYKIQLLSRLSLIKLIKCWAVSIA